jgi:pimeloyl-ACP methyl ester carboxylesterase
VPRDNELTNRQLVTIGDRQLAYWDVGAGSPVVVLEAGLEYGADTWAAVQPGVAAFTRVVSYDRAGIGASTPAAPPRSAGDMADDLHALLQATKIVPPYVLAAHSFGGLLARIYTHRYSAEVAGMVLVASSHPDQWDRWADGVPAPIPGESTVLAVMRQRRWNDPAYPMPEGLDLRTSRCQLRDATSLGNRPLRVLSSGGKSNQSLDFPPDLVAHMARVDSDMQGELSRLSSNGMQIIAGNSGHFIQLDEPELVVTAIRDVVHSIRAGQR